MGNKFINPILYNLKTAYTKQELSITESDRVEDNAHSSGEETDITEEYTMTILTYKTFHVPKMQTL